MKRGLTIAESYEQQARNILERMGWDRAQTLTAGDVAELANLLVERDRLRRAMNQIIAEVEV